MVSRQESCTSHPSRIECSNKSSTLDAIATDEFDEKKNYLT